MSDEVKKLRETKNCFFSLSLLVYRPTNRSNPIQSPSTRSSSSLRQLAFAVTECVYNSGAPESCFPHLLRFRLSNTACHRKLIGINRWRCRPSHFPPLFRSKRPVKRKLLATSLLNPISSRLPADDLVQIEPVIGTDVENGH